MGSAAPPFPRVLSWLGLFLAGSAVFALAYCQAPLYYSNQNQYFLHGLAQAHVGLLDEDWLANTRDPTPLFSGLVALTVRYLHPWAFYAYDALLMGLYAGALLAIFFRIGGTEGARRRWPVFAALLVLVHSALLRWLSFRWLGQDYPWYLQAGLAGQYLLGFGLQPSVFGVLLVAAVALFVWDRPYAAGACAALAATLHFTYLLPAGLVVCGFLAALLRERKVARAARVGFLSLGLVLPTVAYVLLTFRPTSPQAFAESQALLVNVRIPHHARPDLWLDGVALAQLAWLLLGIILARDSRLVLALAVPAALATVLTAAQVVSGSDTLALLFPWRISAVLVPLATAVILARLVAGLPWLTEGPAALALAAGLVLALVAGGVWISANRLGYRTSDAEQPLLDFARRTRQPGDVYLLPVPLFKPSRGSFNGDFKPQSAKTDGRLIPPDLQRFRLATGVPIFVDFKSIPYQDVEVLEWHDRLLRARAVQELLDEGKEDRAVEELRRIRVTHVVVPSARRLGQRAFEPVHEDSLYRVYRVRGEGPT